MKDTRKFTPAANGQPERKVEQIVIPAEDVEWVEADKMRLIQEPGPSMPPPGAPWPGLPADSRFSLTRRMRFPEEAFRVVSEFQDAINETEWHGEPPDTIRLRGVDVSSLDADGMRKVRFDFERTQVRTITFYNSQINVIGHKDMDRRAEFNDFDFGEVEP